MTIEQGFQLAGWLACALLAVPFAVSAGYIVADTVSRWWRR